MNICSHFIPKLVCIAVAGVGISSATNAQTMNQAVMIALSQYPAILAAQSKKQAAESDITRAQSSHWPQVSWMGTYSAYNSGNVSNTWVQSPVVSMNVWSGWRIQSDVEKSKALSDSASHQQRITRDDVALLCIEGYLNWAHQIQLVKLARENLDFHKKILGDTEKILSVDTGRKVDRNQALVRFQNAKITLAQRESDLAVAVERLNRMLLGQTPSAPTGIEDMPGLIPTTAEQALLNINPTHPVIAQQMAAVEASQAALRGARSGYSPTVNVTYGKQTYQGSGQGDYVAQLVVSVPIFQGGLTYGAVGTAMGNLEAAEQNLKESKLIVRERVLTFWSELESARDRIQSSKNQIKTTREVVDAYWHQFQVGRRSLLDLLYIQSDLFNYQSNQETAQFEERLFRARLLAATGMLANAYLLGKRPDPLPGQINSSMSMNTVAVQASTNRQIADWMKTPGN